MNVNARDVFLGAKAAIPEMRKARGGSIISMSSVAVSDQLGKSPKGKAVQDQPLK